MEQLVCRPHSKRSGPPVLRRQAELLCCDAACSVQALCNPALCIFMRNSDCTLPVCMLCVDLQLCALCALPHPHLVVLLRSGMHWAS